MLRTLVAPYLLAVVFAAGCSSNPPVHGIFGPAGGTLTNDGATLTIPPGALASETTITMTPSPGTPAPDGTLQVGTPQILAPEGLTFNLPVTLEMTFDPSRLAGHPSSGIAVYTAPVSSTSYTTLRTSMVDTKHVSAQTTHFSIFQPAVRVAPLTTTSGSTGTTGGNSTSAGTTTGGESSGKPATATGGSGGNGTTGSASGGTTTGAPDAGQVDAGPDGGEELDGGSDGGEATDAGSDGGVPSSGGTAICSSTADCIGVSGCVAMAVDSKVDGGGTCNNPFLAATVLSGGFDKSVPPATAVLLDFAAGDWFLQLQLPCCPASTGTMAITGEVSWGAGGNTCDQDLLGPGTIDFTSLDGDGGLAGTFTASVVSGMNGSFSFPSIVDSVFCDAGLQDLPPAPGELPDAGGGDAGTADCSADLDCFPFDGGVLSGAGLLWLNPSSVTDETWCTGPLFDLASATSISGTTSPTLTVTFDNDFLQLQAALPCCPAGPGTLTASSIVLASNICGSQSGVLSTMLKSAGTGSVTFTQTDGGLVGSIHLDGTPEADATFSIP